jgi:hypothetical protein
LLKQFDTLLSAGNGPSIAMEVLVPRSARSIPRYANLQVRTVGRMSGTWWEQLDLPRYCRGELLLTLSGGAPILHSRNVITIHDAAVFAASGAYSPAYRLWYQKLYRRMARKAEHIFTVSNFSKAEIVKWCAAAPEKISVTGKRALQQSRSRSLGPPALWNLRKVCSCRRLPESQQELPAHRPGRQPP